MDVSRILSGENEFQHTLPDGTRQVVLSSASHYPGFYIAAVIPVQSPPSKGSGCAFDTAGRCSLRLRFVYVCIIYGWAENVCTAWFTGLNDSAE